MTVRGANYKRRKLDNYPTPEAVAHALFNNVVIGPNILEPACGKKRRIVHAAIMHKMKVLSDDIVFGFDFLTDCKRTQFDIVTNPPFGVQGRLAMQFIEHALRVTKEHQCKVAMLLPVDFDSGKTRQHVFGDHPAFAMKLVLLDRIKWFKNKAGSLNHAWFIWSWRHSGMPRIKYARIEE